MSSQRAHDLRIAESPTSSNAQFRSANFASAQLKDERIDADEPIWRRVFVSLINLQSPHLIEAGAQALATSTLPLHTSERVALIKHALDPMLMFTARKQCAVTLGQISSDEIRRIVPLDINRVATKMSERKLDEYTDLGTEQPRSRKIEIAMQRISEDASLALKILSSSRDENIASKRLSALDSTLNNGDWASKYSGFISDLTHYFRAAELMLLYSPAGATRDSLQIAGAKILKFGDSESIPVLISAVANPVICDDVKLACLESLACRQLSAVQIEQTKQALASNSGVKGEAARTKAAMFVAEHLFKDQDLVAERDKEFVKLIADVKSGVLSEDKFWLDASNTPKGNSGRIIVRTANAIRLGKIDDELAIQLISSAPDGVIAEGTQMNKALQKVLSNESRSPELRQAISDRYSRNQEDA